MPFVKKRNLLKTFSQGKGLSKLKFVTMCFKMDMAIAGFYLNIPGWFLTCKDDN